MTAAKPRVLLVSTGGTITMTPGASGGVAPTLTGEDLVRSVPALAAVCDLDVVSFSTKPGASLTFADIAEIAALAGRRLSEGHAGAIIVQGTDTIEETAYALDLLVESDKPVVITGAMRGATAPGADGPANMLAAAITACAEDSRNRGSLVVLNDTIHAARRVRKSDTTNPASFQSPGTGPLGHVREGETVFYGQAGRTMPLPIPAGFGKAVAIVKVGLDDDGRMARHLPALDYAGVVIEATGGGHLPSWYAAIISELTQVMPVVLATRVPAGPVLRKTYGFPGSEMDSLARGAIPAGNLGGEKSRVLLSLLLGNGLEGEKLHAEFLRRAFLP